MEVIIYSFFIVSGIAGVSYYAIKKRYGRLLEEEREKAFSLRDSELHLASEKQRLESALKEKEQQLFEIKSHISTGESKASSLSNEVLTKDKQIQSLSAQLQQESSLRTSMEKEISEQERNAASLAVQIQQESTKRSSLANEMTIKEQEFQSELDQKHSELQQFNDKLQQEITSRISSETQFRERETLLQGTIRDLEEQIRSLLDELSSVRTTNESLSVSHEEFTGNFRKREEEYQRRLSETELHLSNTKNELEKTAELLQEQTSIREATEYALQESKQKLYALINELEQKIKDQANAITVLQSELARTANDLVSAQQGIHNLLRLSPVPVFVVNENGFCEFCNPALEDLVGYGMNELSDRHFSRLFPEDERTFYEDQWKKSENRAEQFQGETHIVASTGDTISALVNFVIIQTNDESKKYVGFILDQTTEKDAKKHFTAAKEREQELLDLKSRFIGMVSNQLRTSLVTIATNTELLERFLDKWSDERRYHSFMRINESIRQMIELVRDVTFTTRASTELYDLSVSDINLEILSQSTAKQLMDDLESHHHFILSEQGNISSVSLDEKLVQTIIYQLFSNAFKYSRDNTEVKAHIEQTNSSCIIKISDHGIGVPAAEQKHLFSSFFRGSNVSNVYGTGLGLTIVQQCVQMHKGTISIESELNKGTTVTVTLPIDAHR